MEDLAILIPAYNEELHIGTVIDGCSIHSHLVLVVDDGSTDRTSQVARDHGAKVIRNAENLGLGAAMKRGFACLGSEGIAHIVTIDGDGVHWPCLIPGLVKEHLRSKADLTIGSRFLNTAASEWFPEAKRTANRFATILLKGILDSPSLSDVASGMRVLSKRLFAMEFAQCDYSISYEIISAALRMRFRICEFPISVTYDPDILFCTKQSELLELLAFATRLSERRPYLQVQLGKLAGAILEFRKVKFTLGTDYFVIHPVREHGAYIFQGNSSKIVVENAWLRLIDE